MGSVWEGCQPKTNNNQTSYTVNCTKLAVGLNTTVDKVQKTCEQLHGKCSILLEIKNSSCDKAGGPPENGKGYDDEAEFLKLYMQVSKASTQI